MLYRLHQVDPGVLQSLTTIWSQLCGGGGGGAPPPPVCRRRRRRPGPLGRSGAGRRNCTTCRRRRRLRRRRGTRLLRLPVPPARHAVAAATAIPSQPGRRADCRSPTAITARSLQIARKEPSPHPPRAPRTGPQCLLVDASCNPDPAAVGPPAHPRRQPAMHAARRSGLLVLHSHRRLRGG